jgi:hypothetical protein
VLAQPGCVGLKAGLAETVQRQPVALGLELCGGPERHGKTPPACGMQDARIRLRAVQWVLRKGS